MLMDLLDVLNVMASKLSMSYLYQKMKAVRGLV
jgi:hypothetical protein